MKKIILLLVISTFCFDSASKANSQTGLTITYEYTGSGNDYLFRVKFIRDCIGITAPTYKQINIYSATCALSIDSWLPMTSFNTVPFNLYTPTGVSSCQGGNVLGIEEYIYEGVVTVPPCPDWVASSTACCRNDYFTNILISNPYNYQVYVEARFDNLNFPGNSSPGFISSPANYYCAGNPSLRDYGAFDVDGDSLHYELVNVLGDSTYSAILEVGYTYDQPLAVSVPTYLDPSNGILLFTPSMIQFAVVGVKVSEYRNGILIGSVRVDDAIAVTAVTAVSDTVIGRVYIDNNSNNVYDIGDQAISNLPMQMSPGDKLTTTDGNGKYEFYTSNGFWDVVIPNPSQYTTPNPAIINVNTNGTTFSDGNDFIVELTPNMNDLEVNLNKLHKPVPGHTYPLHITYINSGTSTPTNVDVTLTLDPLLQFVTSSTPPTNIVGNTLTWTIPSVAPQIMVDIEILTSIDLSTTIGTPINCIAAITPAVSDLTPSNNTAYIIDTVASSFVPIYKDVSPSGDVDLAFITAQDWLTYRIYFQNTGTAPVQQVRISDLLDTDLEFSSLEYITSSYPCIMTFTNPNELEFTFFGINLPAAIVDEPGSHGFVEYRIRPKATLQPGMYITNNAGIYFDFNAPVYTNVVHNKVVTSVGFVENPINLDQVTIYPNPASDYCILEINSTDSRVVEIEIYDLMGAVMKKFEQKLTSGINRVTIPVMELSSGVYFIAASGNEGRLVSKFNVVRD